MKIRAFIKGIVEFRKAWTIAYYDLELLNIYDKGRELAHKLTFRRYE